jgi:hypothetical protein
MLRISAVLIVAALSSLAQDSWNRLEQLRQGDRIHVVRGDMRAVDGAFFAVTAETITVDATQIPRADVVRVTVVRQARRARNAAIGAAVGAGVGLGIAGILLAATGGSDDTTGILVRGLLAGAAVGGAAGAAFPPGTTIYRRNAP